MKKNMYKSGFIGIVGRPNVGKSTLLNYIIGKKISITSPKIQTTRNKIIAIKSIENAQFIFIDTPGILNLKNLFNNYMNKTSLDIFKDVDLILYVINVTSNFKKEDFFIMSKFKNIKKPIFLILNKIDLIKKNKILNLIELYKNKFDFKENIPISSKNGDNVDILLKMIYKYLPEGHKYYPENIIVDRNETEIINDIIREKILYYTEQEIPHSVAIATENIIKNNSIIKIFSSIYVERNSQKGILIGKDGKKIKKIKKEASFEIKKLFQIKVFLNLKIKIKEKWKRKENCLKYFGYEN